MIDLRSDTVTHPTPAMREAISRAQVGDDVFGEDPTVNRLEVLAAKVTGKEAALLVPSGTMGNLVSLLAHCGRGERAILGDESHVFHFEAGGASALGGVVFHPVATDRFGRLDLEAVARALGEGRGDIHRAPPGVVCLENTHNRRGGTVLTAADIAAVGSLSRRAGVPLHLDGSRVFNAAVALGCDVRDLTEPVDSVQFCLSKGLCAPVGSLVCGTADFVGRARRVRKMLGGGMRQAGVIATAGVVALESMVERLVEDHRTARLLAEGLASLPGVRVDLETVQTNIVIFEVEVGAAAKRRPLAEAAAQAGLRIVELGKNRFRAVTHWGVSEADVRAALAILGETLGRRNVRRP
jgi:threonine aldolase